jgi:cellulose synthase/poly-beta-1,6-N-acetylglucosamine synthase-like glycosyltransferase
MKRARSPSKPSTDTPKLQKKSTVLKTSNNTAAAQVAVIIPVHNAADYLAETLTSIVAQTYPHENISVHICDDASTDATADMLQEWSVKFANNNIQCVLSTTHDSMAASTQSSAPPATGAGNA